MSITCDADYWFDYDKNSPGVTIGTGSNGDSISMNGQRGFANGFYVRPDLRVRFLQLDKKGRGKYDSEDPEFKLGAGWTF